jgi:hypothetical protein
MQVHFHHSHTGQGPPTSPRCPSGVPPSRQVPANDRRLSTCRTDHRAGAAAAVPTPPEVRDPRERGDPPPPAEGVARPKLLGRLRPNQGAGRSCGEDKTDGPTPPPPAPASPRPASLRSRRRARSTQVRAAHRRQRTAAAPRPRGGRTPRPRLTHLSYSCVIALARRCRAAELDFRVGTVHPIRGGGGGGGWRVRSGGPDGLGSLFSL